MNRLLLFAIALAACLSLDSFLYNPKHVDAYTFTYDASVPAAWQVPASQREEVELLTESGQKTFGVFVRQVDVGHVPTVLYHHGNKWGIDEYWVRVSHIWSLGVNVFVYDYPGYGKAEGSPTESGIYECARAALANVRSRPIAQDKLFHYGYSLGGGPAVEMAKSGGPYRGLVTESIFASVGALVADGSLVVPRTFVTENDFANRDKIASAAARSAIGVLLFHGDEDDFVQPKYADQLETAIGSAAPHEKYIAKGKDHGNVPDDPGYDATLRAFLFR